LWNHARGQGVAAKEIKAAKNKTERLKELVADYAAKFQNPYVAAELGYIDEIIFPENMRPRFCQALSLLRNKRDELPPKKHGNIPL